LSVELTSDCWQTYTSLSANNTPEWNSLPPEVIDQPSVEAFRASPVSFCLNGALVTFISYFFLSFTSAVMGKCLCRLHIYRYRCRCRCNTINWQTLFASPWRWLQPRLSKRQSSTTVPFKTAVTWTITQDYRYSHKSNLPSLRTSSRLGYRVMKETGSCAYSKQEGWTKLMEELPTSNCCIVFASHNYMYHVTLTRLFSFCSMTRCSTYAYMHM